MASSRNLDGVLLFLRLVFGAGMLYGHGLGKIERLFGGAEISFADPFGIGPVASLALAAFAEVLCALLLVFGAFTRWAILPLIVTMLVAVLYSHAGEPFAKMEKGVLYLAVYISLFVTGPGWYSLDAWFKAKK